MTEIIIIIIIIIISFKNTLERTWPRQWHWNVAPKNCGTFEGRSIVKTNRTSIIWSASWNEEPTKVNVQDC